MQLMQYVVFATNLYNIGNSELSTLTNFWMKIQFPIDAKIWKFHVRGKISVNEEMNNLSSLGSNDGSK